MKNVTIQRIIEIPLSEVQSEHYYKNIRIYGGHSATCLICGKRIKQGKEKLVHLLTNGNIVSYSGHDIESSQGFFPIGSDCAKKLVIQFAW